MIEKNGPNRRKWSKHLGALDALEMLIVMGLGTALFVGVVVAIPVWIIRELLDAGRVWMAGALTFVELATVSVVVRDIGARKLSGISMVVVALWLACVAWVVIQLYL